jgi:hypothetical protein
MHPSAMRPRPSRKILAMPLLIGIPSALYVMTTYAVSRCVTPQQSGFYVLHWIFFVEASFEKKTDFCNSRSLTFLVPKLPTSIDLGNTFSEPVAANWMRINSVKRVVSIFT